MKFRVYQVRRLSPLLITVLVLIGCASPDTTSEVNPELPTPTLFGTVSKRVTNRVPTSPHPPTPRPDLCVFPIDLDGQGANIKEAALYRFNWIQGINRQTIETRDGPVTLEASVTTPAESEGRFRFSDNAG